MIYNAKVINLCEENICSGMVELSVTARIAGFVFPCHCCCSCGGFRSVGDLLAHLRNGRLKPRARCTRSTPARCLRCPQPCCHRQMSMTCRPWRAARLGGRTPSTMSSPHHRIAPAYWCGCSSSGKCPTCCYTLRPVLGECG